MKQDAIVVRSGPTCARDGDVTGRGGDFCPAAVNVQAAIAGSPVPTGTGQRDRRGIAAGPRGGDAGARFHADAKVGAIRPLAAGPRDRHVPVYGRDGRTRSGHVDAIVGLHAVSAVADHRDLGRARARPGRGYVRSALDSDAVVAMGGADSAAARPRDGDITVRGGDQAGAREGNAIVVRCSRAARSAKRDRGRVVAGPGRGNAGTVIQIDSAVVRTGPVAGDSGDIDRAIGGGDRRAVKVDTVVGGAIGTAGTGDRDGAGVAALRVRAHRGVPQFHSVVVP